MATKKLSDLTKEQRRNLITKLGETLNEFEIDADIKILRRCSCLIKTFEMKNEFYIEIKKDLKPEEE